MPDLCQLADVKAWLAIASGTTSEDALLQRLITATSYDFLREIGRFDFTPAKAYTETREGDGGDSIILRHWPINSVTSITVTVPSNSPPDTSIPNRDGSPPLTTGYYIDSDIDPERLWEVYLAGYTFTDLARITIQYNAGYATVPADAEQAVIEWVSYRYKSRQFIGQASKHMNQGETVATPEVEIPMSVARVIKRYKRYDPLQTPPEPTPGEQIDKGKVRK